MNVCIIGGGASGMVCAITLKRNGHNVTIFEHKDRVGKKILMTGNGRCNISNADQDLKHYYGDESFIKNVFDKVDLNRTIDFFRDLGIVIKNKNGYLYPYSEQASAVLDVLRFELRKLEINVITDIEIKDILPQNNEFIIQTNNKKYTFDRCVIATGSKAYKSTGSDGSGYKLVKNLGHLVVEPLPALTKLFANNSYCKALAGVRADGEVSIFVNDTLVAADRGEIQYTKEGISGIPVFQVSHYASRALFYKCKVHALIDLCPDMSLEETYMWLNMRIKELQDRTAEELFIGFLNKNIAMTIIKNVNIKPNLLCSELNENLIILLTNELKNLRFDIHSTGDYDNAQICCGGVCTDELTYNLESKLIKGLYMCGEIIDVHGDCGGYNLQWAWSSGILVGGLI